MLFCLAFSGILSGVQHQNTLHLASKWTAFCTKTHSIQHQNALRLAPKCTALSTNQPQNGCKWQFFEINIHFACVYMLPPFASKQTFARIDFLRQDRRLVDEKGTHNVKFIAENQTKDDCATYRGTSNGTEDMYAYFRQRERLTGVLLIPLYLQKHYMSRRPQLLFLLPHALKLTNSSNHQLANLSIARLIKAQTHKLTNPSAHKLINS